LQSADFQERWDVEVPHHSTKKCLCVN